MRLHFFILLMISCTALAESSVPVPLTLIRVLTLESPFAIEPSGLARCQGKLLMVSDKNDEEVYELTFNEGSASAQVQPARRLLDIPQPPETGVSLFARVKRYLVTLISGSRYDWEGISCDRGGNLYLLSESLPAILRVSPKNELSWLDINLYSVGRAHGLFTKTNAYLEGIAWHDNKWLLAAEREPRALMTLERAPTMSTLGLTRIQPHLPSGLPINAARLRAEDFTDLLVDQGYLYTLERNASVICRRDVSSYELHKCWSYAHMENAPRYRYLDDRYGLGEGAAVFDYKLYIVMDNNGDGRKQEKNDKRPLMFEFELPTDWSSSVVN